MSFRVIVGSDDYLLEQSVRKHLDPKLGLEVIDSLNSTNAELQLADIGKVEESVVTPSLFDPVKVTWWKNVHFLPSGGKQKLAEEVKEALEGFAERMAGYEFAEGQALFITAPALLATSIFAKRLKGVAEIVILGADTPRTVLHNAAERAVEFAEEFGVSFQPGVAERFAAIAGSDARTLRNEVMKLRDFLGPDRREITGEDVLAVTSPGIGMEPAMWDITDAVGERNLARACELMRNFEGDSGFAVVMSATLERFFRDLINVAAGRTEGMHPYAVSKNRGFLRKWNVQRLRVARARFLKLRERAVSGADGTEELVTIELIRAMR